MRKAGESEVLVVKIMYDEYDKCYFYRICRYINNKVTRSDSALGFESIEEAFDASKNGVNIALHPTKVRSKVKE